MLELWGMWSTPSLPSLSGLFWPGVVAPDRVLPMDQIKLQGSLNKFPDFFRMGTFIDSTHRKL